MKKALKKEEILQYCRERLKKEKKLNVETHMRMCIRLIYWLKGESLYKKVCTMFREEWEDKLYKYGVMRKNKLVRDYAPHLNS